jgi:hypothetical protein
MLENDAGVEIHLVTPDRWDDLVTIHDAGKRAMIRLPFDSE